MDEPNYFQVMLIGIALLTGGVIGGAAGAWRQSRKQPRLASAEASPVFKPVLDSTHDALYLLKPVPIEGSRSLRFRVEDCNEPACRQVGMLASRVIGLQFHELFPAINAAALDKLLLDAHRQGHADGHLEHRQPHQPAQRQVGRGGIGKGHVARRQGQGPGRRTHAQGKQPHDVRLHSQACEV